MVEGELRRRCRRLRCEGHTNPSCTLLHQSPRFNGLVRPYTAEQVVSKRGTIELSYPSNTQGKKLHALLKTKAAKGEVSHTYGA